MLTANLARRRVMRWVVAGAVAVVATGVVVGGALLSRDAAFDELVNRRVAAALEQAPPAGPSDHSGHSGHSGHGEAAHPGHGEPANPHRRVDIDGHELRCVAAAFGHDPPGATAIEDITVIYAHRMCAAVGPGLAWPASIRETGPVAVRLGAPDTLVLPEKALPHIADANYADRIRAVIPRRYHEDALAYADFVDPDVAAELQDRLED